SCSRRCAPVYQAAALSSRTRLPANAAPALRLIRTNVFVSNRRRSSSAGTQSAMMFALFSITLTAAFFAGSLLLLNYGRRLGLRYLKAGESMAGLATVEGAVFALIGLLVAFTVSGALQRYDERRLMVVQEASAVSTAYDRLGLFEEDTAHNLR